MIKIRVTSERDMWRACSDAYGKGICRSNQESTNLRIGGTDSDVTSAESFHTAFMVQFPGKDLLNWREAIYQNDAYVDMLGGIVVDRRHPDRRTALMRNIVFLYGHRDPEEKAVWNLSPYGFMVHWELALATFAVNDKDSAAYQAKLEPS